MNKINLAKYGFERSPKDDFSDDGNRFYCYRHPQAPEIQVSKLVDRGEVYLSCSRDGGNLTHDEYSVLPGYQDATWTYNGATILSLEEKDLEAFRDAVITYNNAYKDAEAKAVSPSKEDILNKLLAKKSQATTDAIYADKLLKDNLLAIARSKCGEYSFKYIMEAYRDIIKDADVYQEPDRLNKLLEWYTRKDNRAGAISLMKEQINRHWRLKHFEEDIKTAINTKD